MIREELVWTDVTITKVAVHLDDEVEKIDALIYEQGPDSIVIYEWDGGDGVSVRPRLDTGPTEAVTLDTDVELRVYESENHKSIFPNSNVQKVRPAWTNELTIVNKVEVEVVERRARSGYQKPVSTESREPELVVETIEWDVMDNEERAAFYEKHND